MRLEFDPFEHPWKDDPYRVYRELREHAPVHYSPVSDSYTVSRYADAKHVLTATDEYSSAVYRAQRGAGNPLAQFAFALRAMFRLRAGPRTLARARMLIAEDGPVHAAMRNLVNRGFTPRGIAAWEARVEELASGALDGLGAAPTYDVVEELAVPLPVTVICEFLGVDARDRDRFKCWSDRLVEVGTGNPTGPLDPGALDAMSELRAYLAPIVRARRARPQDDLISTLVTATGEAALSDHEVFLFVVLLLVAGNETTTNLIGNAVDTLLAHPGELRRVVADPALLPGLVEEALRFDSPIQFITRQVRRETELAGTTLPAGATVVVMLASANRDERVFPDPDRFDISRDTRGHLAFGFGPHFCLGAALARLEARCALSALLPRLPSLARAEVRQDWTASYQVRGRARLALRAA